MNHVLGIVPFLRGIKVADRGLRIWTRHRTNWIPSTSRNATPPFENAVLSLYLRRVVVRLLLHNAKCARLESCLDG